MRKLSALLSLLLFIPFFAFSQGVTPGVPIGHSTKVAALDYSPNGKYIVTAGDDGDGDVKIWEAKTGRLLVTWDPANDRDDLISKAIFDVVFYDDDHLLVCARGMPMQYWNFTHAQNTSEDAIKQFTEANEELSEIKAVSINPKNSKEILALDANNRLRTWNVKNQKLLKTLQETSEKINSIAYEANGKNFFAGTKDGKILRWSIGQDKISDTGVKHGSAINVIKISDTNGLVLSGDQQSLKLWEAETGKENNSFARAYILGKTASFSTDGKQIAFGSSGMKPMVVVYNIETEEKFELIDRVDKIRNGNVLSVCFSDDGQQLISGYFDGSSIVWDLESKQEVHRLESKPRKIMQMGFTTDHSTAFIIYKNEKDITIWSGKKGKETTLKNHQADVLTAAFSPDEEYLLSSDEEGYLIKWDFKKDSIMWQSEKQSNAAGYIAISAEGKYAMTVAYNNNSVKIWDMGLESPKVIKTLNDHSKPISAIAFSVDGKKALSGGKDAVHVYDVENEWAKLSSIPSNGSRNNPVGFSEDGNYFISVECLTNTIEYWNISENERTNKIVTKNMEDLPIYPFVCGKDRPVFSPTGKYFITPSQNEAYLWSVEGGSPLILDGHTENIEASAFVANGRIAVTGSEDGTIKFWNTVNGDLLVTIYQMDGNNWVAITPNGLFDATPDAMHQMYFINYLETIDLEQLKDIYHEPDLLPILMGHIKGKLREVVLDSLQMYPEVTIEFKKDSLLNILLDERTGGIGKVSVYINGSEIIEDARSEKNKNKCDLINIWDYESHFYLSDEEIAKNVITVRAYNEGEWLKSPPIEIYPFGSASKGDTNSRTYKGKKRKAEAGLYAIVVGTHDYKEKPGEKTIDLKYSSVDAKTMVTALNNITEGFIRGPKEIVEITTADPDVNNWPTKSTIRKAFDDVIKKSKAEDVFVLFLSGHGKTYSDDKTSDFYYLTSDCSSMDLSDDIARNNFCIPTDTLTYWISKIPAKKRVIIMDACESGAGAKNMSAAKSLTTSQKKELEMLKDRNGSFVLASSESGQQSYEDWNRKQGLLTYSLMDGLVKTDGRVSVLELFQHSIDVVPDLAKDIRAEQTPVLTIPSEKVESFTIGWVDDPSKIPMSGTRDLIAPCLFLDKNKMNDHLYLSNLIDEQLDEGEVPGKLGEMGRGNPKNENVYGIRGLYEVKDGTVILIGQVFKNTTPQGEPFKVEFSVNSSPQDKENKIINEVNKILDGLN